MAAVGHWDSAINNQNNFFLANPGDGDGWVMAQYARPR